MSFLQGSRILVTGGAGFLGRSLCLELDRYRPSAVVALRRAECDLRDPRAAGQRLWGAHTVAWYEDRRPKGPSRDQAVPPAGGVS